MNPNLSFTTAYALLKNIERYAPSDFDALGITPQQFEIVAQPHLWDRDQLLVVMRTLTQMIYGSLTIMALPKLTVPSEFIAAHITALVAPENRIIACVWLSQERQTGHGALEMAARGSTSQNMDPTSADNLFALVCLLSDRDDANDARKRYMKKIGIKIAEAKLAGG